MKTKLYALLVLLTIAICSFAQDPRKAQISGTVKTADGHAVAYITVSLKDTPHGTTTDDNGNFRFEAPAGDYTMVVYSILAHKEEFPVTIKPDNTNVFPDLKIIENKNQLNEVVVTGQFSPQSLQSSIYKVKVITSKQIQQKAATDLQTLLNTEIGIRLSNDMALGETDFEIMGMSGNNVKVLIDGIPMIDRLDKKQSLSQIDVNTIERVEIVEGPMSVTYGTDALAGVINIITKKGKLNDGKHLAIAARVQEESIGDEYDLFRNKGKHIQNINGQYTFDNGLYFSGNFTRNMFGGWQGDSTGRKKQWQPKDQYLTGGKIGYAKANYSVSYRLDYLNENLLTEADINKLTNITSDKEFIVNRYTHQLQGDWKVSNRFSLSASGSYQDYTRRTRTTVIDLNTGAEELSLDAGAQDKTTFSAWFGRVVGVWKATSNLSLQPGVEFQSDEGTGDRVDGAHRINNGAAFLSLEYNPAEWVSIRPGVRSSFNSAYDPPLFVPALNMKFNLPNNFDLRLSYARGFRAPTLQELYYSFHDSNHNIDGNPDLKAEYSNSYMGALTWRPIHGESMRLTTTLSGFYNDFRDRISLLESTTQIGYNTYYNSSKYRTVGSTLENSLVWKSLSATLNISYVGRYNQYKDLEKYKEEDMDKFRYSPEISASVSYAWDKVVTFNLFYKFTGKRREYTIDNSQKIVLTGMNSFNWADFTVSREVLDYFTVLAGVKNIFDITSVRNSASNGGAHSGGAGFSQMACGRSYFVGLVFNLRK